MQITRHFIDIESPRSARRVHYRRCGEGPPLLMVHQSPRSSAEYETLMRRWAHEFTCIAPDTPGFGQSDPLGIEAPSIVDYADAVVDLVDALGIAGTAAYGFHSGGIILVAAMKRHPDRFAALAVGGYAVWTAQEVALFGQNYLPHFLPSAYGEHLVWAWNRLLEQTWFFPWFDTRNETRMLVAHDDPERVQASVMDLLDAGNAYRDGYGAVINAPRDIPDPAAKVPPCLITAYDGDPLQAHIDRLGEMPANWAARKVKTPQEHWDESLVFLRTHRADRAVSLPENAEAGFIHVRAGRFDGLIHWLGRKGADRLIVHGPAREAALTDHVGALAIDLPGHGLSDRWNEAVPEDWQAWRAVIEAAAAGLGAANITLESLSAGDPDLLYPDLSPERHGSHLTRAWSIVRAERLFSPWYCASAANAIPFEPGEIASEKLAVAHRARLRGVAAKAYHVARVAAGQG